MGHRQIRATALLLLIVCVVIGGKLILIRTGGELVLPLEGGYVNATVGRNLFFYKVWGVSKYQFMPEASSLLYPMLLGAAFFIPGQHLVIPILVNLATAIWLLLALHRWMLNKGWPAKRQLWLLVVASSLLPVLVLDGTEYVLYILIAFLFLSRSKRLLDRRTLLYAILLVATRYEGILIILLMSLQLIIQSRRIDALKLLPAGLLSVIVYGVLCRLHQYPFVPLPLITISGSDWWLAQLTVLLFIGMMNITHRARLAAGILVSISLAGIVLFARTGQQVCRIYQSEYSMTGFLRRYYYRESLVTNHPGVMSYFTDGKKFNLNDNALSDSAMRSNWVLLIILSDKQPKLVKPQWWKVATWQTKSEAFTFYALDSGRVRYMREQMQDYRYFLSKETLIKYD